MTNYTGCSNFDNYTLNITDKFSFENSNNYLSHIQNRYHIT